MQIEDSDEQSPKVPYSMHVTGITGAGPDSNVRSEREQQPEKHSERYWIEEGMAIDKSDWQPPNARGSIDESPELCSNATLESIRHCEKEPSRIISTEEGMQIARRAQIGLGESRSSGLEWGRISRT
jgi:hypothetical protein